MIPGDPLTAVLGDAVISKDQADQLREQYGFNDPLVVQYFRFASRALQGDLGRSLQYKRPVLDEIGTQLPATIQLTLASMAIAVVVGMGLGVIAALRPHSWLDSLSMV